MVKDAAKDLLAELKKFSVGSSQWVAVLKSNSQSNITEKKLDGLLAALVAAGYSLEVLEGVLSSVILSQPYIDQLEALPFTPEQIAEVVAVLSGVVGNITDLGGGSFSADSVASSATVVAITGADHLVGGAVDLGTKTLTVSVTSGSIDAFEGATINKTAGVLLTNTGVSIIGTTSTGIVNNGNVRTGVSSLTSFVLSREVDGVYIDGTKLLDNAELPAEVIQLSIKFISSVPFSVTVTES